MAFFTDAVTVLQTLTTALGAGLGIWGIINLMEGYGNDNRATRCFFFDICLIVVKKVVGFFANVLGKFKKIFKKGKSMEKSKVIPLFKSQLSKSDEQKRAA